MQKIISAVSAILCGSVALFCLLHGAFFLFLVFAAFGLGVAFPDKAIDFITNNF